MKKFYKNLSKVMLVVLMALIPLASMTQEKTGVVKAKAAPSHSYWSVGVFGGVMQFNGDLSKNLWVNLYPNSIGYNFGVIATKQFTRVIGVRARMAFGMVQSRVDGKYTWDYEGGNGTPKYISQSFKSTIFESDFQLTVNWVNWILGCKPERFFSSYLIAGFGMDQSQGTKRDIMLNKDIAYLGKKGDTLNVGNNRGMGNMDVRLKLVAGIGFDFNINKHFSIPVEFTWRLQNSDLLDMTRGGAKEVFNDMYSSGTIGLTYKFAYTGGCHKVKDTVYAPAAVVLVAPQCRFSVYAPKNIPAEIRIREIFPLRNYVFFNSGSTEIPDRYVLITKDQVKDFKEDQLEKFAPKNIPGRSERQMVVYYNILNILGTRMVANPTAIVRLTGASMQGPDDGKAMAESVRKYLVDVFGIDPSRINTEGRVKPRIPSEQPGGTKELDLLREGDRRVSIWSASPALLMEFQSGEDAQLKPVEIFATQTAPVESYVSFYVECGTEAFASWTLAITDDKGIVQNFGLYTQSRVSIPGKSILGSRPQGDYKVTMTGQAKNGMILKKDTTVNMVLWTPPKDQEVMRFSIIYEFNESKAIAMYEKYLTDVVMPKIPQGGMVIIHGYTDIIGDEAYNLKLSLDRAYDVKGILENGLSKAGRTDVKFSVYGFGEDEQLSPFENKFPEERFYNRTVIIDIVPEK